jgi:ABC-2 type transport system ATP-binding protein
MHLPPALSLQHVSVRYGSTRALDRFSLTLHTGEIVGLLGPNGSGKSTTLGVAAGLLEPMEGEVFACGIRSSAEPCEYARMIGLVPQEPALYDELSAEANLQFFGRLYGLGGYDLNCRVALALNRVGLTDRARDRVGTFSGGMKQKINLAAALLHEPQVILLDEPTAALDPKSRDQFFAELHRLREVGHAILLTTHHLDEAEHGCDRIVVMEKGRAILEGKPSELIRHNPTGRPVLYGQLRESLPHFFVRGLQQRLGPDVEVEVTGRRLRLAAATSELLGQSLSLILSDGIAIDTFRTPPGRLETLLRTATYQPEELPCDVR